MWPWRDWVIHAYNTNLSYDKFITWQIAGDLIPNATKEQIIATGFNRNHKITQEGGVIPEEYRSEYVADRTNTTSKVMMGLTMECARCHSHKYDDISHEEYYGMYSYFNNVDEDGLISYSDKAPKPNITVTRNDIEKDLGFINLPDSISEVTFMVMKETENLRKTYILNRGSYDSPTKEVKSMTPTAVLPINKINSTIQNSFKDFKSATPQQRLQILNDSSRDLANTATGMSASMITSTFDDMAPKLNSGLNALYKSEYGKVLEETLDPAAAKIIASTSLSASVILTFSIGYFDNIFLSKHLNFILSILIYKVLEVQIILQLFQCPYLTNNRALTQNHFL